MLVSYHAISHIGNSRKINQDRFVCGRTVQTENEEPLFMDAGEHRSLPLVLGVFDGLGGESCGEQAAGIAAERAAGISLSDNPEADLLEFCIQANQEICTYAAQHGIHSMGTTAALLALTREGAFACNVGDSRIYQFHNHRLCQISTDHLLPGYFYGRKPPLTQSLGIPETELLIEPDASFRTIAPGDRFLICSDGLTDMVEEDDLQKLMELSTLQEASSRMLETALEHGGRDNVTLIICELQEDVE